MQVSQGSLTLGPQYHRIAVAGTLTVICTPHMLGNCTKQTPSLIQTHNVTPIKLHSQLLMLSKALPSHSVSAVV